MEAGSERMDLTMRFLLTYQTPDGCGYWDDYLEMIEASSPEDAARIGSEEGLCVDSADHYSRVRPRLFALGEDLSGALLERFSERREKVLADRARLAEAEMQRRRETRESNLRREIAALEDGQALRDAKSRLAALLAEKEMP